MPQSVPAMRTVYLILGCALVPIGIAGVVLPVLPGFVFLLLATVCFARSSPRFESWMLNHPQFGESLRIWREEGSMRRKHKVYSVGMIAISAVAGTLFSPAPVWVKMVLAAAGGWAAWYILTRPTRKPNGVCPLRPPAHLVDPENT